MSIHSDAPQPEEQSTVNKEFAVTPAQSAEETSSSSVPSEAAELPPEARGEANGGPLGCCLGSTIGMLSSLLLIILSRAFADQLFPLFKQNYVLIVGGSTAIIAILCAVIFGVVGWRIGKRIYREYDPPVLDEKGRRIKQKKVSRTT